jgi:VIT1/CCC1 family predicted Fe2+/Mn2+ transporter
VQRVGAFIIGVSFVVGGLTMIAMSFRFKGEFQAEISSPPVALMVSLLAVMMALAVASFVIWLGGRLLAGCFRHSH